MYLFSSVFLIAQLSGIIKGVGFEVRIHLIKSPRRLFIRFHLLPRPKPSGAICRPHPICLELVPGIRTLPMTGLLRFQYDIGIHGQRASFADR